jgi:hypothetical protein
VTPHTSPAMPAFPVPGASKIPDTQPGMEAAGRGDRKGLVEAWECGLSLRQKALFTVTTTVGYGAHDEADFHAMWRPTCLDAV